MTKNSKIGLPDRPSALIRLALRDLAKAEKTPGVKVDMAFWYSRKGPECTVCLAGSILAQHFDLSPFESVMLGDLVHHGHISHQDHNKLWCLDEFRNGNVRYGLETMRVEIPEALPSTVPVTLYNINPTQFKTDMRALAKTLKENGL